MVFETQTISFVTLQLLIQTPLLNHAFCPTEYKTTEIPLKEKEF